MSEENEQPEALKADQVDESPLGEQAAVAGGADASQSSGRRRVAPLWLLPLLAIVPAVIVGVLVFVLAGSDEKSNYVAVLDGFVRRFTSAGGDIQSYASLDAPGFPADFPRLGGAEAVAVFAIRSEQGTTFIVGLESGESVDQVYAFYLRELDSGPWQVEAAVSGLSFTGVQFSRPDSADVQADITISSSELDGRTAITLFYSDISQQSLERPVEDFVLPQTRDLPPDFPEDIPLYSGESETVVTEAFFRRDAGQVSYFVAFLTRDADVDVIDFYKEEFRDRGWQVIDGIAQPGVFSLTIEFEDTETEDISGTVMADFFVDDPDYTIVEMLLQVSPTRGR